MEKRDVLAPRSNKAHARSAAQPRAVSARFDARARRVVVTLSNNLDIAFAPENAQGLEGAKASELREIVISPSGLGIHFPKLDADIYIPSLLEGLLGSAKWMAARMGRRGGAARSDVKAAAARRNGRLGGRPRKNTERVA